MKLQSLLFAVTLVAVSLAGCADVDEPSTAATPTSATPATGTPATTPTPDLAPPTDNETDEGHDMPTMLDCPDAPSTTTAPGSLKGYPELVFTVSENATGDGCYAFVGPATAKAGWTAITLNDTGMEPHIMVTFFLGNRTLDDFVAAMKDNGTEPEWATSVGGVGVVTPFQTASVIVDLQEGNYAFVCYIAGHHFLGMYRQLSVGPADAAGNGTQAASEPAANYTVTLRDFAFDIPNMTAGQHVIRVVNNGTEAHEFPLIRLQGNATIAEFLGAIEGGAGGPPPGAGVGGVNILSPGMTAYFVVDLTPGNYGSACFVHSKEHEKIHLELGMVTQFTVPATAQA